jgi:3-carboxy-cis,cis-muconate cycloisomerase
MTGYLTARVLGTPAATAAFGDRAFLSAMLRFEATLAAAEAELGIIPAWAAARIAAVVSALEPDAEALAAAGANAGSLAIPLVDLVTRAVAAQDADAARYVHHGATSQDVLDTALALCTRDAVDALDRALVRARDAALRLAHDQARTPMLARTLLQPAGVTTFGLKAARWASALERVRQRIGATARHALAVSLGGAAGDLAALGEQGDAVRASVAARLGLHDPGEPWHTARDGWIGLAADAALAGGTLRKIARDVALLGQAEVAEVAEPDAPGRGGSTAMPHKRNPVLSMRILAATQAVPALLASLLAAMDQEHERGLGGWQAEMAQWPTLFAGVLDAALAAVELLGGLRIDASRCLSNIDALGGVIFADRLARTLDGVLGKAEAEARIAAWCRRATDQGVPLVELAREAARRDPALAAVSADAIEACFDVARAAEPAARLASRLFEALGGASSGAAFPGG